MISEASGAVIGNIDGTCALSWNHGAVCHLITLATCGAFREPLCGRGLWGGHVSAVVLMCWNLFPSSYSDSETYLLPLLPPSSRGEKVWVRQRTCD